MSKNTLISLRDILAHLYPDEASARRIVEDAEIDPSKISFTSQAKNNWHAILNEARKVEQDNALLDIVLGKLEYRDNTTLQKAVSAYRKIYNYSPISSASDDSSLCPYKGLFAFGPDDADFFFGREKVIEDLIQLTNKRAAIPILGASGSGKSSLVMAGLVPALQRKGGWKFVHFHPGKDPFLSLAKALIPLYEPRLSKANQTEEASNIANKLRDNKLTVTDIIEGIQGEMKTLERLLLIADQFEELFTLCPDEAIQHQFVDSLIQSCQPLDTQHSPLVIVFTLRADFLAFALNNRSFAEALASDVKLGPMTQSELKQAVALPAQQLGVSFEEGLVEHIVNAVENKPGNLPLLEFALSLLWEKRIGNQITHSDYEAIDRVEGSLARYANEQYDRLTDTEKELTQYIFTQLVHPGKGTEDTRQIAIMNDLDRNTWPVIRKLADLRLVVTSHNANTQETVEVVHEALIRHWGKLDEWMNKIRAFRVWQEQLRFELKRWNVSNQDEGALLRGTFLAEAKGWLKDRPDDLGQAEHNFIQTSIKQHEQEQKEKKEAERNRLLLIIRVNDVAGQDLSQADLVGANLSHTNLNWHNLYGANLQGASLQEAALGGANLQMANLQEANLYKALLTGANLHGANLYGANLRWANLDGANLQEANLQWANLDGATLDDTTRIDNKWRLVRRIITRGAANQDLSHTDLRGAWLQGANLQGANLQGASLQEANLAGANLNGAHLDGAHLQGASLAGANLHGAHLDGANLQGASLHGANLHGANLQGADLHGANLQEADLQEANLDGATLDDTTHIDNKWLLVRQIITQGAANQDLSHTNLRGAWLQGADLQGAWLVETNLVVANLDGANLQEANLDGAWLTGAKLQWADLHGANLHGANLQGADLHGANLQEANLHGADLHGADLHGADLHGADLREAKIDDTTHIDDIWRHIR